jgi:serine/threonine-protein kinase HipA
LGEGKNPTTEHLLELAKKYGLKKGNVIIDEVREAVSDWASFAKEAKVSKKSWQGIATVLEQLRY